MTDTPAPVDISPERCAEVSRFLFDKVQWASPEVWECERVMTALRLALTARDGLLRRINKAESGEIGGNRVALYDTDFDPQNWIDERDAILAKGETK